MVDRQRALRGTGSVFLTQIRGRPTWCAAMCVRDKDGKSVKVRGFGSSPTVAVERRTTNLQKRLGGFGGVTSRERSPKISSYLDEWLSKVGDDEQNSTSRKRNRRNLEQHVLPHLDKPLTAITVDDIQQVFKKTLPKRGATASSIYNAYASLRALLNFARRMQVVPPDFDPLKPVDVRKPVPAVREFDDKYIERRLSISKRMLTQIADPTHKYQRLFPRMALMFLGLRRAELLGLEWRCVHDLDKKDKAYLTIEQQLMRDEETGRWSIVKRTKNGKSRDVPLPEFMRLALVQAKRLRVEAQERWAQDLLFLTETGHHVSYNQYNDDWRMVLGDYLKHHANDPTYYFRPHAMRRLCVNFLADAGQPLETARKILGHRTINMTEYYHSVSQTNVRTAIEALDVSLRAGQERTETANLGEDEDEAI